VATCRIAISRNKNHISLCEFAISGMAESISEIEIVISSFKVTDPSSQMTDPSLFSGE